MGADADPAGSGTEESEGFSALALGRLKKGLDRTFRLFSVALGGFGRHRGTQLAASMAYYALFSIFPAAIVAAAAAGFILDSPDAREDTITFLLDELPLTAEQGRSDLTQVIEDVANNSGTLGLIGAIGLLISSSALMGAVRNSLNIVFGGETRRGAIRGKAVDLLFILLLGSLIALSFAATIITQLEISFTGRIGEAIESTLSTTGLFLPVALAAVVFGLLYRYLPVNIRPLRDLWPGILFAASGYEIVKRGFSAYLDHFANYSAVYGSLGAVIAFMFFIYLAGIVFLIGAELAAAWRGVREGEYDPDPDEPDRSFGEQVRDLIKGLFIHNKDEDGRWRSGPPPTR